MGSAAITARRKRTSWVKPLIALPASLLLAIGSLVVLAAAPSAASLACDLSGHSNKFIGENSDDSTAIYGVRSRIEYQAMDLCSDVSTSDGGVSAWSMLSAPSVLSDSNINFAQVGYTKLGDLAGYGITPTTVFAFNTTECFATLSCGPTDPKISVKFTNIAPPSGANFYAVYLNASDDFIYMVQNGVMVKRLGYDVTGKWKPNWFAQYFGETFDYGDDVMGTPTNKTNFDYLQWYSSSGALIDFSAPGGPQPAMYGSTKPVRYDREYTSPAGGGHGFRIWTK